MNTINRNIVMTINDDNLSLKSNLPDDQEIWMRKFNLKCLAISGRKCSQKLDDLMELYISKMKTEMNNYGPFIASNIVHHMNKTMLIFYLFHQDINEFIEISQWTRNMVEIISLYCQWELRAAQRRRPGKEADSLACRRIMAVLWSYVKNDQECMIHVLLKMPNVELKHRYILDPIYRKLLLNQKRNNLTDFEYIRNVLAFKLWKRLHYAEEKKVISEMALCELSPPKTLSKNYRNYTFLPQNINFGDIHNVLITAKLDIQMVIKGYFDHLENPRPVVIEVIDLTSEEIQTVSNNIQSLNGDLHNSSKTVCANNIDQINDDFLLLKKAELIEIDPKEPNDIVENIEIPGWCASLIERLKKTTFLEPLNNEVSELRENPQDIEVSVVNEASEMNEVSKVDKFSKVNNVSTQNEEQNKENQGTRTNKDNFVQMVEQTTRAEIALEKEIIANCAFAITKLPQTMDIETDAQPMLEPQNTNMRRAISDSENNISDKKAQLSEDNTFPVAVEVIDLTSMSKPKMAPPILSTEVPCWYDMKASKPKVSDDSQASCLNIMTAPLLPAVQDLSHASSVPKPEMAPPILPAEVPYWPEIKASKLKSCDYSQTSCPNVLVNINVRSCNSTEDEIHLPFKKRRFSSCMKVAKEDKYSYPATPMLSIAELITYGREMGRPFRTLAELKEFPRISDPYSEPIVPDPLQSNESKSSQNSEDSQNPQITYTPLDELLYFQIYAARIAAGKSRSSKQK